ncbi:MAG: FAD-dependent oxidoreductase [Elusimicrobia bacterium]|nr:FAD-dependent oxidoreductase [Elusimicrobiota bacterium]
MRTHLHSAPIGKGGERFHAVVVGGGFAGASAASALAEAGVAVTLIEERPTLGGRTCSFKDGVTKQDVDNGQHLLLGAYRDTRAFLKRLRVDNRIRFEKSFRVPFINRHGRVSILEPRFFSGNLGLLVGLCSLQEMGIKDQLSLSVGLLRARFASSRRVSDLSVSQWLSYLGQTPGARRAFWDPLCLATLNERPDRAAARALLVVLKEGLLAGGQARALGHASVSLSRLWSMELGPYLQRADGQLALKQKATGFRVEGDRVTAVDIQEDSPVEADVFILATSLSHAAKMAPSPISESLAAWENHDHSPIVGINLWFKEPPFKNPMVSFIDMDLHWVFNRETLWGPSAAGQISAVISAARAYEGRSSIEMVSIAMADLRRAFPAFREEPLHSSVIWERHATPSPTPAFVRSRPPSHTPLNNFFLAGDWVDTGLPPTIEAAARSGHHAAALALSHLRKAGPVSAKEPVPC